MGWTEKKLFGKNASEREMVTERKRGVEKVKNKCLNVNPGYVSSSLFPYSLSFLNYPHRLRIPLLIYSYGDISL